MRRRKWPWVFAALALALVATWLFYSRSPREPGSVANAPVVEAARLPTASIPAPAQAKPLALAPHRKPAPGAAAAASADGGINLARNAAAFGELVEYGEGLTLAEQLTRNAAQADAHLDKLCANEKKLRENLPLTDPSGGADAASFMAPLVDYEKPLDQPPGRLHINTEMANRLTKYGNDWPAKITDQDLAGLDFSWLTALSQFDHWSLLSAGRLRDLQWPNFYSVPIPNYSSLMYWGKLRYAAAFRSGDLTNASSEVRHLADLLRTQGVLIADMVAVVFYKMDGQAQLYAASTGADVSGWTPADPDLYQLYRNTDFASIYYAYPGVSADTLRRAIDCMPDPCVALIEGAGAHKTFGSYATSDNSALIQSLAVSKNCDSTMMTRAMAAGESAPDEALDAVGEFDTQLDRFLGP